MIFRVSRARILRCTMLHLALCSWGTPAVYGADQLEADNQLLSSARPSGGSSSGTTGGSCSTYFNAQPLRRLRQSLRDDLSKVMRSNPDFFFRSQITKNWITHSTWSQYKGFIYGDGHIGNLGPLFSNGQSDWGAIDLDDLGIGPLVLGLTKSILLGKVVTKGLKVREAAEAFVSGLESKSDSPPSFVRKYLIETNEQNNKLISEYAAKHSQKNEKYELKIKLDEGMSRLNQNNFDEVVQMIKNEFAEVHIFDIVKYKKRYGGSKNALRFRALVKLKQLTMILDIKQALNSAVSYVDPQYDHEKNVTLILNQVYRNDLKFRRLIHWKSMIFTLSPRATINHTKEIEDDFSHHEKEFIELSYYNLYIQGRNARSYCESIKSDHCAQLAQRIRKDFDGFISMLKTELIHPSLEEFEAKLPRP